MSALDKRMAASMRRRPHKTDHTATVVTLLWLAIVPPIVALEVHFCEPQAIRLWCDILNMCSHESCR